MQKINKTVASQIISGVLKFLAAIVILVIIVIIIPLFLGIIKGKDIPPVDDSGLQLQIINIPYEENAFYDLDKAQDFIDTKNVPEGKQLVSDYLESDGWNQEAVKRLLDDNEAALQNFTSAAAKGNFQLPYTADPSKISRDIPVTPINGWREISRLSGVKAIWLAKGGKSKEALDEAFKSIIIGNAIENSQSLLITNLVGISIKDNGLDVLRKVISIIPKDSSILPEYRSKLENYKAKGNSAPLSIEYLVWKQSWNNFGQDSGAGLGTGVKILLKNKFYFKKNLTISYYFDFFNKLAIESRKDCAEVKKVQKSIRPLEENNLIRMYLTENLVGKHFTDISEIALNNVLEKKCAAENKLKETVLIIDNGIRNNPASNQDNNGLWQTSIDKEQNIRFQYPTKLTAGYISLAEWPPVVTVRTGHQLDCLETPATSSLPERTMRRQVDDRTYCVSASSEGAAGSVYTAYSYSSAWNGKIVRISFTLRYPQCYNYDDPKRSECQNEREAFDLDGVVDRIFTSLEDLDNTKK